jgi:hypothetical protein
MKAQAPRLEIVLTADKTDGPFQCALVLHLPDGSEPETLGLFNRRRLNRDEVISAMLQIYTALGEQFQHAEFSMDDNPARPETN